MQEAAGVSVANGKAYGICSCSGEEREDAPKCIVEQTDPEQLSITCKDGYSLTVSRLSKRRMSEGQDIEKPICEDRSFEESLRHNNVRRS